MRCQAALDQHPDAKIQMYLVYLKYWTLNLMPRMVYTTVLFRPNFGIKGSAVHKTQCTLTSFSHILGTYQLIILRRSLRAQQAGASTQVF